MNSPRRDIKLIQAWLKMAEITSRGKAFAKHQYAISRLAKYMRVEVSVASALCVATGLPPEALFCFYSLNNRLPRMHEADFISNSSIELYLWVTAAGGFPGYVDQHAKYIYDETVMHPRK